MYVRSRVVGIIIRDKKLLLVRGAKKFSEYWTPGGGLEEGETELECLKRELGEELGVKLISAEFFGEYSAQSPYFPDRITRSLVYIAKVSGEIKAQNEITGQYWMSKKDFLEGKYPLIDTTRDRVIPDLIKKGVF